MQFQLLNSYWWVSDFLHSHTNKSSKLQWPLPPPTILESLESACQKFQYGGSSGDSLYCGN